MIVTPVLNDCINCMIRIIVSSYCNMQTYMYSIRIEANSYRI